MSEPFFISDLHFGHAAIIGHSQRPFWTVKDMDDALIANWNRVVGKLDEVWVLGDVSFHKTERSQQILDALNGRLWLVRGNHDKMLVKKVTGAMFQSVRELVNVKVPDKEAADGKNQWLICCHYPLGTWERAHYGTWQLHGHSHGSYEPRGKQLDVGVDATARRLQGDAPFPNGADYRPISYSEVKQYMATRTFQKVDHHEAK